MNNIFVLSLLKNNTVFHILYLKWANVADTLKEKQMKDVVKIVTSVQYQVVFNILQTINLKATLRIQSIVTAFPSEHPRVHDPLNASHPSLQFVEQTFEQSEYLMASQPKIGI